MIAALVTSIALASGTPHVVSIWPSARSIPANALRLYVSFDRPARGRVATRDVRLLDASGRSVDGAFIDFGQDLWSPDGRRLTVLFDPGRVKRDVEGDGDSAAPLRTGHSFSIEVAGKRFSYQVTPAVRTAITPQAWQLVLPKAGSREAFMVRFDREMDAALLRDQLEIVDAQGHSQPGTVTASADGRAWAWSPQYNWRQGPYQLVIGSSLEDVSGNRVGEALDHDVGSPDAPRQGLTVPFLIQTHYAKGI